MASRGSRQSSKKNYVVAGIVIVVLTLLGLWIYSAPGAPLLEPVSRQQVKESVSSGSEESHDGVKTVNGSGLEKGWDSEEGEGIKNTDGREEQFVKGKDSSEEEKSETGMEDRHEQNVEEDDGQEKATNGINTESDQGSVEKKTASEDENLVGEVDGTESKADSERGSAVGGETGEDGLAGTIEKTNGKEDDEGEDVIMDKGKSKIQEEDQAEKATETGDVGTGKSTGKEGHEAKGMENERGSEEQREMEEVEGQELLKKKLTGFSKETGNSDEEEGTGKKLEEEEVPEGQDDEQKGIEENGKTGSALEKRTSNNENMGTQEIAEEETEDTTHQLLTGDGEGLSSSEGSSVGETSEGRENSRVREMDRKSELQGDGTALSASNEVEDGEDETAVLKRNRMSKHSSVGKQGESEEDATGNLSGKRQFGSRKGVIHTPDGEGMKESGEVSDGNEENAINREKDESEAGRVRSDVSSVKKNLQSTSEVPKEYSLKIDAHKEWKICNSEMTDYIPCHDNFLFLHSKVAQNVTEIEKQERHCPSGDELKPCLVPLPEDYKEHIKWPESCDQVWQSNIPSFSSAKYKNLESWVTLKGDKLLFSGGGTQFKSGADKYVASIEEAAPEINFGKQTKVMLDVGAGVGSFSAFLDKKSVSVLSIAPKDRHESQMQMVLERGFPAMVMVMATRRLSFPSNSFDAIHCGRCRVKWRANGGALLLEVNRLLRPGGYFIWSAPAVYLKTKLSEVTWDGTRKLANGMCWKIVARVSDAKGFVVWQKPTNNSCLDKRVEESPPFCYEEDNADAAWYIPAEPCLHKIPVGPSERGSKWPLLGGTFGEKPKPGERLGTVPYWLEATGTGIFGRPRKDEFERDSLRWLRIVGRMYLNEMGIDWTRVRNVMDCNALYGGFGAAIQTFLGKLWVMNVVPVSGPDTLPIIFERGLLGVYHDWCEAFSTHPRSYDFLHVNHVFSAINGRCDPVEVILELDRIARPDSWIVFRERSNGLDFIRNMSTSLHWVEKHFSSQKREVIIGFQKGFWRPIGARKFVTKKLVTGS